MLGQRRRRWINIEPTLGERLVFAVGPIAMITNGIQNKTPRFLNQHWWIFYEIENIVLGYIVNHVNMR